MTPHKKVVNIIYQPDGRTTVTQWLLYIIIYYTDYITILDVAAVDSTDESSSYCEAIGVYQDCML